MSHVDGSAEHAARLAYQAFMDRRAMAIHRFHNDPEFSARIKVVISAIRSGRGKREWTAIDKRDAFMDAISAVVGLELVAESREKK